VSGRDFAVPEGDAALRRCALTLHAVEPGDRVWLLAQLPADQRAVLGQLVAELQAIGIPRDRQAAREAMRTKSSAPAAPAELAQAIPAQGGQAAPDVRVVAHLLQGEPPALIAFLLDSESRERSDAILVHLDASKRRQVQELSATRPASDGDTAPRLRAALSQELARRLAACAPVRVQTQAASGWLLRWRKLAGALA